MANERVVFVSVKTPRVGFVMDVVPQENLHSVENATVSRSAAPLMCAGRCKFADFWRRARKVLFSSVVHEFFSFIVAEQATELH